MKTLLDDLKFSLMIMIFGAFSAGLNSSALAGFQFRKAWSRADVTLTASRFMGGTKTAIAARGTGRPQRP